MIENPQQCIDFITGKDFPLAAEFTAFEKPCQELDYYWSYRNRWPGMNYRIEVEAAEEYAQVRFFGEQDLRDKVWNEFIKPVEDGDEFDVVAPGTICVKDSVIFEYPFQPEQLVKSYEKLLTLFDQMVAIRGF